MQGSPQRFSVLSQEWSQGQTHSTGGLITLVGKFIKSESILSTYESRLPLGRASEERARACTHVGMRAPGVAHLQLGLLSCWRLSNDRIFITWGGDLVRGFLSWCLPSWACLVWSCSGEALAVISSLLDSKYPGRT